MRSSWTLWIVIFAFSGGRGMRGTDRREPVDYSWGLESVLAVAPDGALTGAPKTLSFNAGQLFVMELGSVPRKGNRQFG